MPFKVASIASKSTTNRFPARLPRKSSKSRYEPPACLFRRRRSQAFRKYGYEVDHQTGSHIILRQPSGRRLTVPNHRELAKATLRALIREAGITKEQFGESL